MKIAIGTEGDTSPVKIFRFFSGGVALVFLLLLILPGPLKAVDPINRSSMVSFSVTYGAIFIYLMIPGLEGRLKKFYMPPVLLAASIIPIAIINSKYRFLLETGTPFSSTTDTMTVTILLLFPLIITAWQYSFPIVFLFYVVLGFLDPLLIILVNESFTPEIYSAFNASLIRILALSAVGFVITELRDRQRREKSALEEANRKLGEYASARERLAASRERNRIARDLHDTLAHTLSGLAIQLEAMDTVIGEENQQLRSMIDTAHHTVRNGLGETRRALKALRASPLDDMGLPLALQRLVDDAVARDSISSRTDIVSESPEWSEVLEEAAYRVAQEALENVVRHAHASEIVVNLRGSDEELILSVTDNGRGFQADKAPGDGQFGLRGMNERAVSVGATLTVESAPNKGTTIQFEWVV